MRCNRCNSCRECACKAYVNTVTFADGTLTLTLPDNISYTNGGRFCFIITTPLPDEATVNAPVVAVVGTGTTEFPVLDRCGAQVVAQQLRTRRRYPFRVSTNATSGSVVLLCDLPDVDNTVLAALNDAAEGGA